MDNDHGERAGVVNDHERAVLYAEQAGRLSYYVLQLLALDQIRDEVPASYLREALHQLADYVRRASLPTVTADSVAEHAATHRRAVEHWRYRQRRAGPDRPGNER